MPSLYTNIAGIDVHKHMLAVAIASAEQPEQLREQRKFGATLAELRHLAAWLEQQQVHVVVMESTAQYWKPVWAALEQQFQLQLAQAQSNRGPRGRKTDFRDAARLIRRWVSGDLILSYVPATEQRGWRRLTRTRVDYTRQRGALQNHIEGLLVEAQIQLSGLISDLLGVSGRRILRALAEGQHDAAKLAELGEQRLRASRPQLQQALEGVLPSAARLILRQLLDRIESIDRDIAELDTEIAGQLCQYQDAMRRLCQMPGVGLQGACQILAEVGPNAEVFPSPEQLASWVGVCPGREESAGQPHSQRSPKGNRPLRRLLCQIAWAAVRTKGSYFQSLFRRLVIRLGSRKALWAIAHRMLRLIWKILHQGVAYRELGTLAASPQAQQQRKRRILNELQRMGYHVTLTPTS